MTRLAHRDRRYFPIKQSDGAYTTGEEAPQPVYWLDLLGRAKTGFEAHKFRTYMRALWQYNQRSTADVAAKDMCIYRALLPAPQPQWTWAVSIHTASGWTTGTDGEVKVTLWCGDKRMTYGAHKFDCGKQEEYCFES